MSADEKRATLWALETEIRAFTNDLRNRLPRDNDDVRVQHLRLLKKALAAVGSIEVAK